MDLRRMSGQPRNLALPAITDLAGENLDGGTDFKLTWTKPDGSDETTIYRIYRSGVLVHQGTDIAEYTVTGGVAATEYTYLVGTIHNGAASAFSNGVTMTIDTEASPPALTVDYVQTDENHQVTFSVQVSPFPGTGALLEYAFEAGSSADEPSGGIQSQGVSGTPIVNGPFSLSGISEGQFVRAWFRYTVNAESTAWVVYDWFHS